MTIVAQDVPPKPTARLFGQEVSQKFDVQATEKVSQWAGLLHMAQAFDDERHGAPREKKSTSPITQPRYPASDNSYSKAPMIYEDKVTTPRQVSDRRWQPKSTKTNTWHSRIASQGPWDEEGDPISLQGASALPMPVEISDRDSLVPFFSYIKSGISNGVDTVICGKESLYNVETLEFKKGVLYSDGRMDLCKKVLGPWNVGILMSCLKSNSFVRHFLLGNNIIGPTGAAAISAFCATDPNKIETWYLAGNCIGDASFKILVQTWINSISVTNIWLKRNPLGPSSARDLYLLITQTPNLRTLDLDQTKLSDAGVSELFSLLASYSCPKPLPLLHIYLNATGVGPSACSAIASFLSSPNCSIESLYLSNNPIGDSGLIALSHGLRSNSTLRRIRISSSGLKNTGVSSLLFALTFATKNYELNLMTLDIGQSFATLDLGTRYNYLTDGVEDAIVGFLHTAKSLRMLVIGSTALSCDALNKIAKAVCASHLWCYTASSILEGKECSPATSGSSISSSRINKRLLQNIHWAYGKDMTLSTFAQGEARFLRSPRDVRFIDSVYRNRDMALARKGEMVLKKRWDEGDETLKRVISS